MVAFASATSVMPDKKAVKYPINFEAKFYQEAQKLAEERGITLAGLIRMLLKAEIRKAKQP